MTAAILFSKPSRRSLENGRLLGSAATRRTRGAEVCACAEQVNASRRDASHLKREHIERSSLSRILRKIGNGIGKSRGGGRIAGIEIGGHERAGPAADAGENRDVLLVVRTAKSD